MSSNTQNYEAFETTSIVYSSIMSAISLLIIVLNWKLSRLLISRRHHPNIQKLRKTLIKGREAVKNGKLTPIETVILALEAGMNLEDVRLEFAHVATREEILESVFGKLNPKFLARLTASGRFMETGYANEKIFLDLWKSESYRELVNLAQRSLCPTQSFHPSYIADLIDPLAPPATTVCDTKPSDPAPAAKSKRKTIIDKMANAILNEERPLLCSGNNDDAH